MRYVNGSSIYEQIKGRITMDLVARRYGFEPNRARFISCPFHREDTASCKLYENSFYCFGCGVGGDVIKFVSSLCNLSAPQAALRLNDDFCLGLTEKKLSRHAEYQHYVKKQAEEKRKLDDYRTEYNRKTEEFKLIRSLPKPETEDEGERYAKYLARLDYLENYWFVENHWR